MKRLSTLEKILEKTESLYDLKEALAVMKEAAHPKKTGFTS